MLAPTESTALPEQSKRGSRRSMRNPVRRLVESTQSTEVLEIASNLIGDTAYVVRVKGKGRWSSNSGTAGLAK